MKVLKTILTLIALALLSINVSAQAENKKSLVFEFTVTGMTSEDDATKLDSVMMTKMGVYKSKTDYATKKITVTCADFFDFNTIKAPLVVLGFESPDKDIVGKPEKPLEEKVNLGEE